MGHVSSSLSVHLAWYLQVPQASFIHHSFPKEILLPDVLLSLKTVCAQSCPTLCDPMDCSLPGSSDRGISRQECRSGLPYHSAGDLPSPGVKPVSPALADRFFTLNYRGSHIIRNRFTIKEE